MLSFMPAGDTTITLEAGDKREIGSMDLSECLTDIRETIDAALDCINDAMDDIYTNAVDERERFPENSMSKRVLWLDEVQNMSSYIRRCC